MPDESANTPSPAPQSDPGSQLPAQASEIGSADAADAVDAIRKAAQTADQIAQEIQTADASAPAAPSSDPAAVPVASPPENPVAAGPAAPSAAISAVPDAIPGEPAPAAHPSPSANAGVPPELSRLLAIEVPVIVQLGIRRLSVGEVMRFAVGAIIEFQKSAEEELDLLANNRPVGRGHAVKVGENFGLRLTSIGSVRETIRALGLK